MNSPQILLLPKKISIETTTPSSIPSSLEERKESGEPISSVTGHASAISKGKPNMGGQSDSPPAIILPSTTFTSSPNKSTLSTAEGPGKLIVSSLTQEPRKLSQSSPGERKMSFVAGGFAGLLNMAGRRLSITNQSPKIFMTTGGVNGVSVSGSKDGTLLSSTIVSPSAVSGSSPPPTKALFPASFSMIPKAALSPNKSSNKSTNVQISAEKN